MASKNVPVAAASGSDTITLSRALVLQIQKALAMTIDVNVAVRSIVETMDATDHRVGGKLFAIAACIAEQERAVCPASDDLLEVLAAIPR